jgi:hypothetical protein
MERLESTIRRQLVSYLTSDLSLDDFTEWIVGVIWDIEATGDPRATQLAYSIELALAELSSGLLTLDELREELVTLVSHVRIDLESQGTASSGERGQSGSEAKTFNLSLGKHIRRFRSTIAPTQLAAASWL